MCQQRQQVRFNIATDLKNNNIDATVVSFQDTNYFLTVLMALFGGVIIYIPDMTIGLIIVARHSIVNRNNIVI